MSAEEFLEYIGEARFYRCKGKQRQSLARRQYAAYVRAFRVASFSEAYRLHLDTANHAATQKGLSDRDHGRPMAVVTEFL